MVKRDEPYFIMGEINNKLILANRDFTRFWETTWQLFAQDVHEDIWNMDCLSGTDVKFFNLQELGFLHELNALIVGVPFCKGSNKKNSKVQSFPDCLRSASARFPVYLQIDSSDTSGIYDYSENRFLFKGLSFRDIGNFSLESTMSLNKVCATAKQIIEQSVRLNVIPVAIGGDHSITYAFVSELFNIIQRPVIIIQFDAHHDCGSGPTDNEKIHHGNFVRYLLGNSNIYVIQLGVRGLRSVSQLFTHPNLIQITKEKATPKHLSYQLEYLLDKVSNPVLYLSIDLDCLDPTQFAQVDFPIANGFTLSEVISLLKVVYTSSLPIKGIDIVEGLAGGDVRKGDYDVVVKLLAHCLDGLCTKSKEKISEEI